MNSFTLIITLFISYACGEPTISGDMASKIRVCANLSFMFKENAAFIERYSSAAAAGFKAVECDFPGLETPDSLANALQQNNLSQILINAYHGNNGERGFAANPGAVLQFQDSIEQTILYLKATSCNKMHILSGNSLGSNMYQEQVDTMVENLKWASTRLQEEGIVGLIEPINQVSVPGYFLSSYQTASDIIKAVNASNIKLQLDLFHLQMIAGNLKNNINEYISETGHVQVAQAPNRFEPNADGEVNFQYVFNVLSASGYEGFVGAEYNPSGLTTDSINWIEEYGLSF